MGRQCGSRSEVAEGVILREGSVLSMGVFLGASTKIIDRETGVRELVEVLEDIISQAGDLIEGRSPELVAQSRALIRRFGDAAPRQAE